MISSVDGENPFGKLFEKKLSKKYRVKIPKHSKINKHMTNPQLTYTTGKG